MESSSQQRRGGGYFTLVNQLRGIASLMVVWDHFVGEWLERRSGVWWPNTMVERFLLGPLNVIQHMGFLGVALFFLISGFVVARSGALEPGRTFLVRRVLRIFPPLIVTVLVAVAVEYYKYRAGMGSDVWPQVNPASVLRSMTLTNFSWVPQVVIVAVAWTLVIEVIYYALVWATGPIFRSALPDLLATVCLVVFVFVVQALDRSFGPSFFLLSVSVSYVPLLGLGQVVFLVTQRRAPLGWGALVALACWGEFVWGLERAQPNFLTPGDSYGSSISVAVGLFLFAVLVEGKVHPWRILDVVAARSYSLYLIHGIVGLLTLQLLTDRGVAYRWALLAALAVTVVATEAIYRGIEKPSIALGRKITRRWRRPESAAAPPAPAVPAASSDGSVAAVAAGGHDDGAPKVAVEKG